MYTVCVPIPVAAKYITELHTELSFPDWHLTCRGGKGWEYMHVWSADFFFCINKRCVE